MNRATLTLLAAAALCSTVAACASAGATSIGSGPKQHKAAVSTSHVMTAADLAKQLQCTTFTGHGYPMSDVPGATSYACTGSQAANGRWTSEYISSSYGDGMPPKGLPPKFEMLVVFKSKGAEEVLEQSDKAAHAKTLAATGALQQLYAIDPDRPDVVGHLWLVWGNDTAAAANAVNAGGIMQSS